MSICTGPSVGDGSRTMAGVGHAAAMVRSRWSVPRCSGSTHTLAAVTARVAALITSAVGTLVWVAKRPQRKDAMACDPMKAKMYAAKPRARTHAGRLSCMAELRDDRVAIHAAPPATSKQTVTAEVQNNVADKGLFDALVQVPPHGA